MELPIRYERGTNAKLTYLNIFDFVALGQYEYTVTYINAGEDSKAPETRLRFVGQSQERQGKFYILPDTQLFFTAEDASPTRTFYKLDGAADFVPAFPFTITATGEHTIAYYSVDSANNEETHRLATVVVSAEYPSIANLRSDTDEIFISGDSLSVRPTGMTLTFDGVATALSLTADVDIFRDVYGWPTVRGVPSSPTARTEAILTVGGENVDFYRYRLGSDAWSPEFPVSTPLTLTGLSAGTMQLSVNGRSQYGAFLPDADVVTVSWIVTPHVPATVITGTPATPSRSLDATLTVSDVERYRFTIDAGHYRPETSTTTPIVLTGLREGIHVVEVIGKQGSNPWQEETNATRVQWTVDRQYGLRFPGTALVRHVALGEVGAGPITYVWDGRDDRGVVVPPGWYTIRLTVRDSLGRSTSAIQLVRVGDMLANGMLMADAGNASQKEASAFGPWSVWQDQRQGNWDIFARDLTDPAAIPIAIATNTRHQERPRTDGRYVVWEDRQPDSTWDVWAKELGTAAPAFAVTATPGVDERKPVVFWPWVIYQAKPIANPNAPWQLMAHNLLTGTTAAVDSTTQDQVDAAIHQQRIVWQDFRDVGPGEIYLKDLHTGEIRRITNHPAGQYFPVIFDHWIVWADNRATQLDLYGYNLLRQVEVQLTNTLENETRPSLNGKWVVYQEDSTGPQTTNLRLLYLTNRASVQLTNVASTKEKPSQASGKLVWVEQHDGRSQVMIGTLPDLQPVFHNQNTVAVTAGIAAYQRDAYALLTLWHEQVGVSAITRYTALMPTPVAETVTWDGRPMGTNFPLEAGSFLWVKFDTTKILDLGQGGCTPLSLAAGVTVFSYACFPDHYSAYALIRELGSDSVQAIRLLDADTGRWSAASIVEGKIVGEDFRIPPIAVLMLDMKATLASWQPGR